MGFAKGADSPNGFAERKPFCIQQYRLELSILTPGQTGQRKLPQIIFLCAGELFFVHVVEQLWVTGGKRF